MEKVLIQDSDNDILTVMTAALQIEGFTVYPLVDCDSDFMAHIEQFRPHVVVLDYKLAGESCLKALQEIRLKYPHLPVVAASCNSNIHESYSKDGFQDYLAKPFDIDLLYSILRRHIKSDQS